MTTEPKHQTRRHAARAGQHGISARNAHYAHPAGGRELLLLALSALGVVYGDIGTSPLYAVRESFHGAHAVAPTPANILGVLSLIFWSLILVVSVKYILFILRADNDGEGGILALTALATPIRRLARSRSRWIVVLGVFGAALLYGDGVITPAISVLSAVEGLEVATPAFEPFVLPLTLAILIGLFAIQSRGTATIGSLFGPIMLVWFGVLALLGISQIARRPEILQAVNPWHGLQFFRTNGWHGFLVLGTVFLVVTGGEALYADMGHFGRQPIRLGWFGLVLPALLLNYFGQGALLLRAPEAENPFFLMAPAWALYPLVGLATLATIIASQALISGAFSLTMQAEHLGFLPRLRIVHTSPTAFGQIYIPFVNWALLIACVLVVIGFGSSSNLAAAYGIAVTSTMAITTILFAVVARRRWRWSLPVVVLLISGLLTIDLAFLGANLLKIPNGGWFPLVVAAVIFTLMTTWKRGTQLVFLRERELEMTLSDLLQRINREPPLRVPASAIFLSANPWGAPAALLANLKYNHVLHERVILMTIASEEVPHVAPTERFTIKELGHGLTQVTLHFGFMEEPNVPRALRQLASKLKLDWEQIPFFVNRTRVIASPLPGMALWREHLYRIMRDNAASPVDYFCLPPTRVVEIGTTVEV
ncbi:potassium transporter Kup [Kallotenue papyrolyticum]|uniref:potassium transporter Kup n=1 Tax=Kallotenue papyrolyticum TaxID=1325125 RepID=UPI000472CF30|nr:potassium transporter Kup [Kallotenue papyrolyticum]